MGIKTTESTSSKEDNTLEESEKEIHKRAQQIVSSLLSERLAGLKEKCSHPVTSPTLDSLAECLEDELFPQSSNKRKRAIEIHSHARRYVLRSLATERDLFLSYMDDLLLSLNLHQFQTKENPETFNARQGKFSNAAFTLDLISLVSEYRNAVLRDIDESRTSRRERKRVRVNKSDEGGNGELDTLTRSDYLLCLEDEYMTEDILYNFYLRKLRSYYVVLLKIFKRDEKILKL